MSKQSPGSVMGSAVTECCRQISSGTFAGKFMNHIMTVAHTGPGSQGKQLVETTGLNHGVAAAMHGSRK